MRPVAPRLHGVVRAELRGQGQGVRVLVGDDEPSRRDRLHHLDADVPQPARPDHHRDVARPQHAGRLGHGVVRGEAGVGEGGDCGGLERVVQLDHAARRGLEVLRVAPVGVEPGESAVDAVHVVTGPARPAQTAGGQRVQDHLVADRDAGHAVPHRVHPPGVLVPDRVREGDARLLLPLAVEDVQVGPADPGGADPDDHVHAPRHLWLGDVGHLEVAVVADHPDCFHRALLTGVRGMRSRPAPDAGRDSCARSRWSAAAPG